MSTKVKGNETDWTGKPSRNNADLTILISPVGSGRMKNAVRTLVSYFIICLFEYRNNVLKLITARGKNE